MTDSEKSELISLVIYDLQQISFIKNDCNDHDLRKACASLRLLLQDGHLAQCWKLLGFEKEPVISAPKLSVSPQNNIETAMAFGELSNGLQVSNFFFARKALSPDEIQKMAEEQNGDEAFEFRLSEYKDSLAIFAEGKRIKRIHIIQYVANKRGGNHYDTKRSRKNDEAYEILDRLCAQGRFGGAPEGEFLINSKDAVFTTLLSICKQICESPDIKKMIAAGERFLKNNKVNIRI